MAMVGDPPACMLNQWGNIPYGSPPKPMLGNIQISVDGKALADQINRIAEKHRPTMPPLLGIHDRKKTIWVDTDAELAFLREECDRLEAKLARKDAKIKRLKQKLLRAKEGVVAS